MSTIDPTELDKVKQYDTLGLPAFTHHGGDPKRRAILESNHRIREGLESKPRDFGAAGGFGRAMLRIPEFDYPFIRVMFPKIASRDSAERHEGWQEFARSPLSEPYRVEVKDRRRVKP